MTSEEDTLKAILSSVEPLPEETATLLDSLGRFAARDLFALQPLPAFDNSAMDGYAVQAVSCRVGAKLRVTGEQPAGKDRRLTIREGEAIRIFTGAPVPAGADAVIMQEDVRREGDEIAPQCDAEPGGFIRRTGSDLATGQKIMARGEAVTPQRLGLLASQGLAEIQVGTRPQVAVISTGDELALPGATLHSGQIFESNMIMLEALAFRAGAIVRLTEHCLDNLEELTRILRGGLETDALVISGGVSVGEHDLVKPVLRELGARVDLWRVAIKPGKPFLFGRAGRCCIFGLPGNPVSAFVTFLKFVRPALLKMSGAADECLALSEFPVRLASEISNDGDRPHYLRGRFDCGIFTAIGRQESHALFGLSRANALLRVPPRTRLSAGSTAMVALLA
jgi:molybdopterin molybdotransferase